MSEYMEPDDGQDNSRQKRHEKPSVAKKPGGTLEKKGHNKKMNPKVLHKDGSFPDNPYNNQPGGGALEGTVGIGT